MKQHVARILDRQNVNGKTRTSKYARFENPLSAKLSLHLPVEYFVYWIWLEQRNNASCRCKNKSRLALRPRFVKLFEPTSSIYCWDWNVGRASLREHRRGKKSKQHRKPCRKKTDKSSGKEQGLAIQRRKRPQEREHDRMYVWRVQ